MSQKVMEQTQHSGGPNRQAPVGSSKRHTQSSSQSNIQPNDQGWKSADNVWSSPSEGVKINRNNNEDVSEGSEGSHFKRGSQQRLSGSASASPCLAGGQYITSSPYSPTNTELQPPSFETNAENWNVNSEGKNVAPTNITVTSVENGDTKANSSQNFTPSPRSSPRFRHAPVSGESSDEKGDKMDRNTLSVSREGSFDRSVSFQERILDQDKSSEGLRVSDSSRSLDIARTLDSSATPSQASSGKDKDRKESREGKSGEKDKKNKKAWYNVLSPTYKSRSEDLKRLFKDLPSEERLIVDYSCALQKDILVHGRLYVTPNYFSFYSKIFGWETFLSIRCKDIVAMTKEKTALVIPNALQINTDGDKHFFTSFAARDKTYLMLFRIWQNALMEQQMSTSELWHWVHSSYGEELGLTSDDDDYVAPSTEDDTKVTCYSAPYDTTNDGSVVKAIKRNSVDSTEDASQGESNVEDVHLPPRLATRDDLRIKASGRNTLKQSASAPVSGPSLSSYPLPPPNAKEKEELPTDISDSAESEQEKEKYPAPSTEVVVCPTCPNVSSHHAGREVSNAVYALPIDTLFTLLFTNSKFMLDLHTARKTYDVVASPWQSNPETNQKIRQVTYTLTLPTNSFGPKVSHVTETQVISSFSKPSEIYTVDAEASNSGIPYADSFYVSNHWCLTRESATETRLVVWSQVKYKKNVWGFMKNVIDKNAFSGMEGFVADLNTSLLLEVDRTRLRRTKRRRRRAGSKCGDLSDPLLHLPLPGVIISDSHKPTQIPMTRKMTMEVPSAPSSAKSISLIVLCALLTVNAFLYYRLHDLEDRIVNNVSFKSLGLDAAFFKFSNPSTDEAMAEEWARILQHQETLHAQELERWRKAVMEAADYLKKAEETLRSLHTSIPSKQASKMASLLHQLQLLKQMQEQKGSSTTPPPSKTPGADAGSSPLDSSESYSHSPDPKIDL